MARASWASSIMSTGHAAVRRRALPAGDAFLPSETPASTAAKTDIVTSDQPSAEAQSREERAVMLRRGLRRMRTAATLLLVLMTAIFIATSVAKVDWVWLPYLRAFAEAGMVGACADWFAVVALFRRPLGLPIPHTGIIPNNKDRIGGALSRFMTNNFLTAATLNERLNRVDVVGTVAHWLDDPTNAKQFGTYLALLLPRILQELPGPQLAETMGKLTRQALAEVPAARAASKVLQIVWAQGESQALIARAIEFCESYLTDNKDYFSAKIAERSSSWIPKWIDKMIADKVMNGVLSSLTAMRDPQHPWRDELRQGVEKLIAQLQSDPDMQAQGEAFKTQLLSDPLFIEQTRVLWSEVESGLQWGIAAHTDAIARTFEQTLRGIGRWLLDDPDRQAQLNRRIRAVARHLLLAYRFAIGGYIERVVRNWDSTTLVERLELQVGKDLQFIRINGTLVGGLVGLLIFIVSKWIAAF